MYWMKIDRVYFLDMDEPITASPPENNALHVQGVFLDHHDKHDILE